MASNEKLKVIVDELGKEPFNKKYNVISFDALGPEQLLQTANDVFAEIDSQHSLDLRAESPEETVVRMLNFLRVLKYQPQTDISTLRQGLVSGEKAVLYPIIEWCVLKLPDLKKRAYLARFLVRVDVPQEILVDAEVGQSYHQYDALIEEFKNTHKEFEVLRGSAFQTTELRKDIAAMEDEKETVNRKVDRLKSKVEGHPGRESLLELARRVRLERQQEQELDLQRQDQQEAIQRADQRLQRLQTHLKELRTASVGTTPEGVLLRLEEDVQVHQYLANVKLPKELENRRKQVNNLQRVLQMPTVSSHDLENVKKKVSLVRGELSQLENQRLRVSDAADEQLAMFRQQAAVVAKKKETAAGLLADVQQQLQHVQDDVVERRKQLDQLVAEAGGTVGGGPVRGDEFKRYVQQLRAKSTVYKRRRQEISQLQAELVVLTRTLQLVTERDDETARSAAAVENERGVSGIGEAQGRLETTSENKALLDRRKGDQMTDMSALVVRVNDKIAEHKVRLAPLIKDLRALRQRVQQMGIDYDERKQVYDSMAAGLESNNAKLQTEVAGVFRELVESESREHLLKAQRQLLLAQKQLLQEDSRMIETGKGESRRQQLQTLITESEARSRTLKVEQKTLKQNSADGVKQMNMWKNLQRLMEMKRECLESARLQAASAEGKFQRQSAGERLEL